MSYYNVVKQEIAKSV